MTGCNLPTGYIFQKFETTSSLQAKVDDEISFSNDQIVKNNEFFDWIQSWKN